MGKSVYIAEKPSVAQEFAKALHLNLKRKDGYLESDEAIVTWCVGHLVTMSYPEVYDEKYKRWSLQTLPFIPQEFLYEVIPGVKKQFEIVKGILTRKDVDRIYVCTDSGREGEYIYRLVEQMAGVKGKERRRVWIDSQTDFVEVRTYIDRRSQVAVQLDVGESRTRESVAVGEGAVQADGLQGIGVGQERTVQSGIHAVAVVVHFIPVVVPHDIAVAVAHVDGVDRGDLVRNGEHVGRTSGARLVLQRLALVVRIAGVGPDFQPFLGLVVGAQTG